VEREQDYAWKVWLQTLPVVWEALMASPFKRRQLYLTGEVPGLMPLVLTQPCDRKGFELIAEEGGNPIQLDLFTHTKSSLDLKIRHKELHRRRIKKPVA
jgi:hypothetical protein